MLADGTSTYLYGVGRIAQQQTNMQYYGADGLGSVRQLYNSSGQIIANHRYDPFGNTISQSGVGASNYGFTGEWTDATGLEYLRARYYAPTQGRFVTRDVWEGDYQRPLTLNWWNYAQGNPVNLTDPSGMSAINLRDLAARCNMSVFDFCEFIRALFPDFAWLFGCNFVTPTLVSLRAETLGRIEIIEPRSQDPYLSFGDRNDPQGRSGARIEAVVEVQEGGRGRLEWVQNIRSHRLATPLVGQPVLNPPNDQIWYVDIGPIYPMYPGRTDGFEVSSPGSVTVWTVDVPGTQLRYLNIEQELREDFRTFLVWRSPGASDSNRVVLGMVEWGWSATAKNRAQPPDNDWVLADSRKYPDPSAQGGSTNVKPVLSPLIQSFFR